MIYLDNAATTRLDEKYFDIFKKYSIDCFYNPSALYNNAVTVRNEVKKAKDIIKKIIKANDNDQIIFTGSGSEADNIALFSSVKIKQSKIIVSQMEHSAIYNSALELKNRGHNVVFAPTNNFGAVDIDKLIDLVDENTELISIIHVSNETGVINDIKEIARRVKEKNKNILVHSDGVQAFGKINVDVSNLGVDLYTISAHKIGGPKGIGTLYVKNGINLKPFIFGGGQEYGIRSSTENVPYILFFTQVAQDRCNNLENNYKLVNTLKQYMVNKLKSKFNDLHIVDDENLSFSPYIVMFANKKVKGEVLLHHLETKKIMIGTGSACSSGKQSLRIPNALGMNSVFQNGINRISFSPLNTKEEIDILIEGIEEAFTLFSDYTRR